MDALLRPLRVDARGVLARGSDLDAVVQALQELLSTLPGERPMRPTWGSLLRTRRYEPNDEVLTADLKADTAEAIATWEPRLTLRSAEVTLTSRAATVTVRAELRATGTPLEASVTFSRGA